MILYYFENLFPNGAKINWLSHIVLSKKNIHYQLGNLLADPLKGKAWEGAQSAIIEGIEMHKAIDSFTDSHPVVLGSKVFLGEYGHLRGVVLDVLYDHFLTKHWDSFCNIQMKDFIEVFHFQALLKMDALPKVQQEFVWRIINSKYLYSYESFDGFIASIQRIEKKLSPRMRDRENIEGYINMAKKNLYELEERYLDFFPELVRFFKGHLLANEKSYFY